MPLRRRAGRRLPGGRARRQEYRAHAQRRSCLGVPQRVPALLAAAQRAAERISRDRQRRVMCAFIAPYSASRMASASKAPPRLESRSGPVEIENSEIACMVMSALRPTPKSTYAVRSASIARFRSAVTAARRARPAVDTAYRFDPATHARDPRWVRVRPSRAAAGLSRHRQDLAHRASRGAAQLAVRAHQPRRSRQPHRPDWQGRDRDSRRQAGDGVRRRHAAVGAEAQRSAGARRVRRGPARRDVRVPARAGKRRRADAARSEQSAAATSCVPDVRNGEHRRSWAMRPGCTRARSC